MEEDQEKDYHLINMVADYNQSSVPKGNVQLSPEDRKKLDEMLAELHQGANDEEQNKRM